MKPPYMIRLLCLLIMGFCMIPLHLHTQYSWDVKDPLDLDVVDFADNKLLLYNVLGIGLTLWLSKDGLTDKNRTFSEFAFGGWKEYNRAKERSLLFLEVRRGLELRKRLSLGGGIRLIRTETHLAGLGFSAYFKWSIIKKDKFVLDYDNGVGPNLFLQGYPAGGTKLNFTTHYGLSFTIKTNHANWWVIKVTNIHLSNADIRGRTRNPALDALGISVGIQL